MRNQTSETTLVQGTVAASAVHVATVATGAFAFIDAIDLSPYVGCKLTLRDSTGRTAVGYVMRAGTGAAGGDLGANTFVQNADFAASAGWTVGNGWSVGGGKATHAATSAGALVQGTNTSGQLVKWSMTVTDYVAGPVYAYPGVDTPQLLFGGSQAAGNTYTKYYTSTGALYAGFYGSGLGNFSIDDVKHEPVTEPPATGVVIASTKGGAVQSWAATTTGFDPNAVTFYSISRVHVATVVASGNLGAGDGGLVLTDGSAKAVPTGVDISGYAGGYYFLTFQDTGGRVYGGYSGSVSDGTGLTIVTAKAGATQNWLIKTASFDKDVALAYKVYHVGY